MAAGYSGTPLLKKLGVKAEMSLYAYQAPAHYADLLGELPDHCQWLEDPQRGELDFVHAFFKEEARLSEQIDFLKSLLQPHGMLWLSWPQKSSSIVADLQREPVRAIGLSAGLVDVKVCAVDEDWSGLKFVYRLEERGERDLWTS